MQMPAFRPAFAVPRRARNPWVPKTHPPNSGDESILVDEVAQDGSSELFGVGVADGSRSRVGLGWCALTDGPVGTVRGIVLDVLGGHDDDRQVHRLRDGGDRWIGRHALYLLCARVDRIDRSGKGLLEQVSQRPAA